MQKRTIGRGLVVTPAEFEIQTLAADRLGMNWREFMRHAAARRVNEVLVNSEPVRVPWDKLATLPMGARVMLREATARTGGEWGVVVRGYCDGRKIVKVGAEFHLVPDERWELLR